MDKVYLSTNDQIHKLISRGMVISDIAQTKHIIEMENYYNLINGYKQLFLDPAYTDSDESYLSGTNFEEIYSLYLFDRELATLTL